MESKKQLSIEDNKSNLILENRKKLNLTGVIEVVSFNDEVIVLNTNLGMLNVKGKELKMNKLDVKNGDLTVIGLINSFVYTGVESKKDKESILAKLFK